MVLFRFQIITASCERSLSLSDLYAGGGRGGGWAGRDSLIKVGTDVRAGY